MRRLHHRHRYPVNDLSIINMPLIVPMTALSEFNYTRSPKDATLNGTNIRPAFPGYEFNGSNDFITMTGITDAMRDNYTIMIWFNTNSVTGSHDLISISKINDADERFRIILGSAFPTLTNKFGMATSASAITIGTWHHVAAVVNHTSLTAKIYIDGVLGNTDVTITRPPDTATDKIFIGMRVNLTNHFDGTMAGFLWYSRDFSAEEIQSIYNTTKWRYGV